MTSLGQTQPRDEQRSACPWHLRWLLTGVVLLAGLHLLVASPHFVVRLLKGRPTGRPSEGLAGISNFSQVTKCVWRGAAPKPDGYSTLAAAGVGTVIDLRAEAELSAIQDLAGGAGLTLVHIPIRDGQPPTTDQLAAIAEAIGSSKGPVFVHCQAGVGRTGSVVGALAVTNDTAPWAALIEGLRFGPLSLEQQVFVMRSHVATSLPLPIVAISRVIDSPRRMWSRLTG